MSDPTQDFYDTNVEEYEQKTKDLCPTKWIQKFMEFLPVGGTVLDIGCAFGRDAKVFVKNGFETTGIDYSKSMVERAKEYCPEGTFIQMDMLKLTFPSESFDGVWSMTSLLHIPKVDIPQVLQSVYSILKPKGVFFIGLKLGKGEGLENDERYSGKQRFYSYFTQEEMEALLHDVGFSIIEINARDPKVSYENKGMLELIAKKEVSEK